MRQGLVLVGVIVVAAVVYMVARPGPPAKPDPEQKVTLTWTEDLDAAKALAAETGRSLLLNFSGSDWCGYCWALDEEIFSTPQFKAVADEKLVLVLIDFPKYKPQPDELKYRNEQLEMRYRVEGYPALIFLSSEGGYLGRLGYMRGGPEPFLKRLNAILPQESPSPVLE